MMHIVDNGVDAQSDDYALPKPNWLRTALFNTLSVGQSVSKAEGDILFFAELPREYVSQSINLSRR